MIGPSSQTQYSRGPYFSSRSRQRSAFRALRVDAYVNVSPLAPRRVSEYL